MKKAEAAALVLAELHSEDSPIGKFPATRFEHHLVHAIAFANQEERLVLSTTYPELVEAVGTYQFGFDGLNELRLETQQGVES